jgi:hypothetical protein
MEGATAMSQSVSKSATERAQRTPEEIFAHHAGALGAEDLDAVLLDYADDACIVTPSGVTRGKEGIRSFFAGLFQSVPQAAWNVKTIFVDDLLFLEWTADSAPNAIPDGIDTFIFRDGLIRAQTVRFSVVPKT